MLGEIYLKNLVSQTLLSKHADKEWMFVDGSHVRADQHSSGINHQDISKSIGGNSSKIHLVVDSNGNPIEFIISDGTSHDIKIAPDLVSKLDLTESEILCADKGYDSDNFRTQIEQTKTKSNIPRKSNTKSNNDHMDWHIYKIKHLVENSFCRLKQFRGISTRYDKLKRNYQSAIVLACIFIWLPL